MNYEAEFAVVLDSDYKPVVLFTGTKAECRKFMRDNPERCDSFVFIQEMECA